ncbi:MAG: BTAD domain-containing putative transcriptional regulator [Candidatus Limnocylindria bacterium]|nr:BTAD domain-containing putative transcriptional regulator [Candidatus Limnocylindria bacterium]
MRGSDFNYKVALASGLKSLRAGQPHKAEEQFRYLREKFPHAEGGYRGSAKVCTELGDGDGALAMLREGAAALAKAGERSAAIGLLRDVVALAPLELGAHRRLAAALILAGEPGAALAEYQRFVRIALQEPGGSERARLEVAYAREQLGDSAALADIAAWIVAPPPEPLEPPVRATGAERPAAAQAPHPAADAGELEHRVALASQEEHGSGDALVAAARRHIEEGQVDAAADLLLGAIGSGAATRDAQRLLLDVSRALGGRDTAREACALLARLHTLDGHDELAVELERLALTV